jgi:hypothetical protein
VVVGMFKSFWVVTRRHTLCDCDSWEFYVSTVSTSTRELSLKFILCLSVFLCVRKTNQLPLVLFLRVVNERNISKLSGVH